MVYEFVNSSYGPLRVWQPPQAGRRYVIGVDTAEGKVRDKMKTGRVLDTANSARDYSCAMVIDEVNASLVATWHGKIDTHLFSIVVYNLGIWFNEAHVAVEVTGPGRAVQDSLTEWEYPNCAIVRKRQFASPDVGDNVEYGFKTTPVTRPLIIKGIRVMLAEEFIEIPDIDLLSEMKTMEVDDLGKERGIGRNKDDRVFSYGIALLARKDHLEQNAPEPEDRRYFDLPAGDRWVWKKLDDEVGKIGEEGFTKAQDVEDMEYAD